MKHMCRLKLKLCSTSLSVDHLVGHHLQTCQPHNTKVAIAAEPQKTPAAEMDIDMGRGILLAGTTDTVMPCLQYFARMDAHATAAIEGQRVVGLVPMSFFTLMTRGSSSFASPK